MIRKVIIVGLTLAAVGTLAGGIASSWVPIRWTSKQPGSLGGPLLRVIKQYPSIAIPTRSGPPIVSLGYVHLKESTWLGRPHIIYYCKGPVGGPRHAEQFWFVAGVWINTVKWNSGFRYYDVHFPLWMPFVLFAAYPTIACIRGPVRRYRRRKRGLCLTCGYNLTGNVSGVCSECGTEIKQPPEPPDAPSDATHV